MRDILSGELPFAKIASKSSLSICDLLAVSFDGYWELHESENGDSDVLIGDRIFGSRGDCKENGYGAGLKPWRWRFP